MKNATLFIIALIVALLTGCLDGQVQDAGVPSDKVVIVTTLFPLYEFAREVGGDRVEVSMLLPPGAEAHSFEPRPSDILKMEHADMFISIGAGMEPWAHDILGGLSNKDIITIDASEHARLLPAHDQGDEHPSVDDQDATLDAGDEDLHGTEYEHDEGHTADEGGNGATGQDEGTGEESLRWAGAFTLEEGLYTWKCQSDAGRPVDQVMKMTLLETTGPGAQGIEDAREKADKLFHSINVAIKHRGNTLTPREMAYVLDFEGEETVSIAIKIDNRGDYAIFTGLLPEDCDPDGFLLLDSQGKAMEPTGELNWDEHALDDLEGDNHDHGAYDPHLWLDFENDRKIVDAIASELSALDPGNSGYYLSNAEAYKGELGRLDDSYKHTLRNCTHDLLISGGHNSLTYLGDRYGFSLVSVYGLSPNSEPTPQNIAEMTDLMDEHGIDYVLFEALLDPKVATVLAKEGGAGTLVVNPGHNLQKDDFENGVTFISIMDKNLESLSIALGCD